MHQTFLDCVLQGLELESEVLFVEGSAGRCGSPVSSLRISSSYIWILEPSHETLTQSQVDIPDILVQQQEFNS